MAFEFYNNVALIRPLLPRGVRSLQFVPIHTLLLLKPVSP